MMKRSMVILLLIAMVGGMLMACDPGEEEGGITSDQAVKIAYEDLNVSQEDVASVHVHEGTYEGELCYNVYINAQYNQKTYVISRITGKILAIQDGTGHSH